MGIKLNNGTYIATDYQRHSKYCTGNDLVDDSLLKSKHLKDGYISSYDKRVERYSLFVGLIEVSEYEAKDSESFEECPISHGTVRKVIGTISSTPIKLQDNTFIMYGTGGMVIHLDDNMQTKFEAKCGIEGTKLKKNFFILTYSVVNEIDNKVRENEESWEQGVQDRLITYLEEKQEKEEQQSTK